MGTVQAVPNFILKENQMFVKEDGVEREVIKIASKEHEAGFRLGYRDTMVEGEHKEYIEPKVKPEAPKPPEAKSETGWAG
jgi:hypothetical protein